MFEDTQLSFGFASSIDIQRRALVTLHKRIVLRSIKDKIGRKRHERQLISFTLARKTSRPDNILAHALLCVGFGIVNTNVAGSVDDGPRFIVLDRSNHRLRFSNVKLSAS